MHQIIKHTHELHYMSIVSCGFIILYSATSGNQFW